MAKEYFEKLSQLVSELKLEEQIDSPAETKHFFSGAAWYVDGTLCASWSPVGLAFKLPLAEVDELIESGQAKPLRYFPNSHIKKGYALFEKPDLSKTSQWESYFIKAAR